MAYKAMRTVSRKSLLLLLMVSLVVQGRCENHYFEVSSAAYVIEYTFFFQFFQTDHAAIAIAKSARSSARRKTSKITATYQAEIYWM